MGWLHSFDFFIFDLDGLLVDTEKYHYEAYRLICANRGFALPWDLAQYLQMAHHSESSLRDQIYRELPQLYHMENNWSILYAEKQAIVQKFLLEQPIDLMPGAGKLLEALQAAHIRRCVVTNSNRQQVNQITERQPLLKTIPHWMTREDYTHAKPDPECCRTAIEKYGQGCCKIIGFDDTPRGIYALLGTDAVPVMICSSALFAASPLSKIPKVHHFSSLALLNKSFCS